MTKIIKLTDPATGRVRHRDEIKADPECQRTYYPQLSKHPSIVDPLIHPLMQTRTKPYPTDRIVFDSSRGYGKTLEAMSAIAQARMSAKDAVKSINRFCKAIKEANNQLPQFLFSPIETTYLQHHQHLPGRKGNARQRKKAFKKAERWYYNVYLKCEVSQ